MPSETAGNNDRPETQILMAAIIRLMAQCAASCDEAQIRTLLTLLRELRGHPDLPRQPAVLASLASAHAIWVDRLASIGEAAALQAGRPPGGNNPQLH